MEKQTKYIYKIYDTEKEEWLKDFGWNASFIKWDKKVTKAKKWGTPNTISEFFMTCVANDNDFKEIPSTWQIRKFKVQTEISELDNEAGMFKEFVFNQVRWPHLYKFWQYPCHEWGLKEALKVLPKTYNPMFAINFNSGRFDVFKADKSFNIEEVRRLLIKAKRRMTGEMRVLLRYGTVFVINEDDLTIIKMMLAEHIQYILNLETGLDYNGKEINFDEFEY